MCVDDAITCDLGLACNSVNNTCECTPGTTSCISYNNIDNSITCSDDGTSIAQANTCELACIQSSGTCLENRQVSGLTATYSGNIITLSWSPLTPQTAELKYRIEEKSHDNDWTPIIELQGTTDFQRTISSYGVYAYRVTGIESGLEMSPSEETEVAVQSSTTQLFFYSSRESTGDLGDRSTTTNTCENYFANQQGPLPCTKYFALLTYSETDSIANMHQPANLGFDPATVPINSMEGFLETKIADSWNALLDDNNLIQSLQEAAIIQSESNDSWWSGSNDDGTFSGNNCDAWTTADSDKTGQIGNAQVKDSTWINDGPVSCSEAKWLVCVCGSTD